MTTELKQIPFVNGVLNDGTELEGAFVRDNAGTLNQMDLIETETRLGTFQ